MILVAMSTQSITQDLFRNCSQYKIMKWKVPFSMFNYYFLIVFFSWLKSQELETSLPNQLKTLLGAKN
jgi:hypothetical protein